MDGQSNGSAGSEEALLIGPMTTEGMIEIVCARCRLSAWFGNWPEETVFKCGCGLDTPVYPQPNSVLEAKAREKEAGAKT